MSGWAAELIGDEPRCAFVDAVNRVICASCEHEAQIRKDHDTSSHTVHVVRDYRDSEPRSMARVVLRSNELSEARR
ncbi:hypothetical protein MK974_22015 [Burkholderia ambifaria]|uniref:hypothetical protein n=1 Tax=Burkholderia ambifaria TaxID=152480 RepID=UPI0022A948E2|nr:hypothetical protein [Burkholderia ambifaria]WAS58204.1 hypothetical protein MK974_22015 [Burkholderia ambifaria]